MTRNDFSNVECCRTITIDSLANFGSLTDIGTSSLKDWFAEENDALLKGLNDSNGYYIWDYMEDGYVVMILFKSQSHFVTTDS